MHKARKGLARPDGTTVATGADLEGFSMKTLVDAAIGTATLPLWIVAMAWTAYQIREPSPRRLLRG
jgi:hypothetical protein